MKRRIEAILLSCMILILAGCGNAVLPGGENPPEQSGSGTGNIYLYGEEHSNKTCLEKELEAWNGFYADGMRDLFIEVPCYLAEYLNIWMQADTDEILEQIYRDTEGAASHSLDTLDFYRRIKTDCPETVFHGTDVGHLFDSMGYRYLRHLESAGQKESEAYALAEQVIEQGRTFYRMMAQNDSSAYAYRENCMAENFIREYDKIDRPDIMGIYGAMHTDPDSMDVSGDVPCMAKQLAEHYGDVIQSENLTYADPLRVDTISVNGKEYEATYFGSQDISGIFPDYLTREYWRLESAYEDWKDAPLNGNVLPYNNYPIKIESGQVFIIDYTRKDGSVERRYYRSDGLAWNGKPSTQEFVIDE